MDARERADTWLRDSKIYSVSGEDLAREFEVHAKEVSIKARVAELLAVKHWKPGDTDMSDTFEEWVQHRIDIALSDGTP